MARFSHHLPFSPHYDFQVCKRVTINGVEYAPGDRMAADGRDAIGERRLRQMYEHRLITPIQPKPVAALLTADPLPDYSWSEDAGGGDMLADGSFDPVAPDQVPGPTAVHKGFGRWFVQYPDGTEAGPMSKEAAEAQVSA